ncbi:hypothetical protein NPIL_635741 [Nephila pilipes]|uniref:Uncharacterized protein n=1 Tax=Nephila pilipes TaxID=299642 RepID=A0A8X6JRZ6_NEPPI|nr:hypothetical protein NPIL_635741 [Nephila pilipes]
MVVYIQKSGYNSKFIRYTSPKERSSDRKTLGYRWLKRQPLQDNISNKNLRFSYPHTIVPKGPPTFGPAPKCQISQNPRHKDSLDSPKRNPYPLRSKKTSIQQRHSYFSYPGERAFVEESSDARSPYLSKSRVGSSTTL